MKKHVFLSCALLVSAFLVAAPDATTRQFVEVGQGEDAKLFLDPYLNKELKEVSGQVLLDAGCGIGNWSIVAALNGATVWGVDKEKSIISKAQAASEKVGVNNRLTLSQGDIFELPYDSASFDRALSVNTGCQLPPTSHMATQGQFQVVGLGAHFRELARVLKEGGNLLVVAPVSSGVLFTEDGNHSQEEIYGFIQETLEMIGTREDEQVIKSYLSELTQVLRATFVRRGNRLVLVTDEKQLNVGEPIWSKTPDGIIANYYHSDEAYLVAMKNAGLTCVEIKRPCFFGKVKYNQYRASLKEDEKGLGEAYIDNHPFTIFYAEKRV